MTKTVDIVFDGPPGPVAGRFVEVEDSNAESINVGEWVERDDGFWALRIPDPRPKKVQQAFVAWTNSDLTEGRGAQYPLAICEMKSTAIRLGKGQYVQGSDCPISEVTLTMGQGSGTWNWAWHGPVRLIEPSENDKAANERLSVREAAIEAAKAAGLSDEQISAIAASAGQETS